MIGDVQKPQPLLRVRGFLIFQVSPRTLRLNRALLALFGDS